MTLQTKEMTHPCDQSKMAWHWNASFNIQNVGSAPHRPSLALSSCKEKYQTLKFPHGKLITSKATQTETLRKSGTSPFPVPVHVLLFVLLVKMQMNNDQPAAFSGEAGCLLVTVSHLAPQHWKAAFFFFFNEAVSGESLAPYLSAVAAPTANCLVFCLFFFWVRRGASCVRFHSEAWSGALLVKVGKINSWSVSWRGESCCFHAIEKALAHAKSLSLILKMI